MRRRLVVASLVASVAGCHAVGPDYVRPARAIAGSAAANRTFAGATEGPYAATPLPPYWWRLYRDPVLDRLVEASLATNTDLRVAAANLARARAGLAYADAARDPLTNLTAAPSFGRRSAEEELIGSGPLKSNFNYGIGASVSYQFDLFGQISRAIEAAQDDVLVAEAASDVVRVSVAADVTGAYLQACAARREIDVTTRLVALQRQSSDLTRRLDRGGRATSLDTVRSDSLEDQVRASIPLLETRRRLALFQLAVLAGTVPSEVSVAAEACVREPILQDPIPIGDGAQLIRRRPDIRRAEHELRAATARIGVATSDLYPRVSIGASFSSIGLTRNLGNEDTLKFSIGPLVTWQFPDRSRMRARIAVAVADEDAAYARFDKSVLVALRETEGALVTYARDLDHRRLLASALDKAADAAAKSDRLFRAGRQGYLPVLDANRTRITLEQAVAAADTRLSVDRVGLFLALGGGWESDSTVRD